MFHDQKQIKRSKSYLLSISRKNISAKPDRNCCKIAFREIHSSAYTKGLAYHKLYGWTESVNTSKTQT